MPGHSRIRWFRPHNGGVYGGDMEPTETVPDEDADRVIALSEAAVVDKPLSPEGQASIERAIKRLPDAVAASDAEARAAKR